ncbi:hypothetical protein [Kitasatospora sp. NPDC001527]|uniref:hypothetical protein n=1 Tax=Kitasatospora sp. NPDC001527 TaxID=3154519 RepID=UPI003327A8B2
MDPVLAAMVLAAGVSLAQLWLKFASRKPHHQKWHALNLEDAIWWIDWVVAASVALVALLVIAAHEHKAVSVSQVIWASVTLLAGYSILPLSFRVICYENGQIKGWPYAAVMNMTGMTLLLGSAAAGASVNGW